MTVGYDLLGAKWQAKLLFSFFYENKIILSIITHFANHITCDTFRKQPTPILAPKMLDILRYETWLSMEN
jgi:hypothetical protein